MGYQELQDAKKDMCSTAQSMLVKQEKDVIRYEKWLTKAFSALVLAVSMAAFIIIKFPAIRNYLYILYVLIAITGSWSSILFWCTINCSAIGNFWIQIEFQVNSCTDEKDLAIFRETVFRKDPSKVTAKMAKETLAIVKTMANSISFGGQPKLEVKPAN